MMCRYRRRIAAIFCVFGVLLMTCAGLFSTAFAEETRGNLTMQCTQDDQVVPGITWQLYRVGERVGDTFVFTGDFANDPVTLGDWSASELSSAAYTLENYAKIYKRSPVAGGTTDENGILRIEDLEIGLYLASGGYLKIGDTTYCPVPILFEINGSETELNAYPKSVGRTLGDGGDRYRVKKIWENAENRTDVPSSVTIGIYKDDELVELKTLSDANKWSATWEIDEIADWRVIELEVPEGCNVIYRNNDSQFVVVNRYEESTSAETTTAVTTETTVTTSVTSQVVVDIQTESVSSISTTTTQTTTTGKLPQTGQLWWPIPVMILGGIVFLGIGIRLILDMKKEEKS